MGLLSGRSSSFDVMKANADAEFARIEATHDRKFVVAVTKAVRDAKARAWRTGEDQPLEGLAIFGETLYVKAKKPPKGA
jgi:hypothetical protein